MRPGIPEFMRDRAVPAATIITPNQFELEYLAQRVCHGSGIGPGIGRPGDGFRAECGAGDEPATDTMRPAIGSKCWRWTRAGRS